jgi:hypothetical protein
MDTRLPQQFPVGGSNFVMRIARRLQYREWVCEVWRATLHRLYWNDGYELDIVGISTWRVVYATEDIAFLWPAGLPLPN